MKLDNISITESFYALTKDQQIESLVFHGKTKSQAKSLLKKVKCKTSGDGL